MKHYIVREIESGREVLCVSEKSLKKDDYIVIASYEDLPVTAVVVETISHYKAIRLNQEPEIIIDTVNVKSWLEQREEEVAKSVLLSKMQNKISEIKMVETLEKYAGRDPEMLSLLNEYKGNHNHDEE
ncbi:hypothetical protein [Erysipelothrix aquatica]|uniref:hypothetical protein n=1 Tax=Erysipelothrix aquatica TaxID=2683714 RepID=UPI0013598BCC|nr:hypothetical protein [Erysipelothrix aquatica]